MSLAESTPPAMPQSISPAAMRCATCTAAVRLVPQARCTSYAGVSGWRPAPSVGSRAGFQSRECLITAPAATSPSFWFFKSYFSTRVFIAAVSMLWLFASPKAVLARAKGVSAPPRIATLRREEVMGPHRRGSGPHDNSRVSEARLVQDVVSDVELLTRPVAF